MKHFYALLFILPFVAASQDSLYSKVYYDAFPIEAASATESIEDFGVTFVTYSNQGMMVVEVDSLGDQNWVHTYNQGFSGQHIISTSDSGYVVAGAYYNPNEQINDPFLMKLDGNGDTLWSRGFVVANPNNAVYSTAVSELMDGSYLMTWMNLTEENIYIANMSSNGILNWSNILGEADFTQIEKIGQASDSSIYLIGYNDPWSDGRVVKLDAAGNIIWGNSYQGTPLYDIEIIEDTLYCFGTSNVGYHTYSVIDSAGAFIKGSLYPDMNNQSGDAVLFKYTDTTFLIMKPSEMVSDNAVRIINRDGVVIDGYFAEMKAINILKANNNGMFFVGNGPIYGLKSITPHVGIIRVDSLLNTPNCLWSGWYNPEQISTPTVQPLSYWETFGIQEYPIYPSIDSVMLIEVIQCVEAYSGIDENSLEVNVYPNTSSGVFNLEIEAAGAFKIKVFDLSGHELLADDFSWTNYQLDLSQLESGAYQYVILEKDSGRTQSGRLILAK